MLQEKQMIENKYEVRKKLNDNGLYMVTDLRMMTLWMVKEITWKEINEKFTNGEKDQETVIGEFEQMKKINHRIFPKIVEILRNEEALYVVMEPVHGKPVQEEKRKPDEIVTWAVQLCDGLKSVGQIKAEHIRWKHCTEDIRQEDGNIRLWDFEIFSKEESSETEEIKEIAEFIRDMIGKKLGMSGKLKTIVQRCISGKGEYETYEALAEALERYVMEDKKRKKFKKTFCSAGAVVIIAAILVFSGNQILRSRKTAGMDNQLEENSAETMQAEITKHTDETEQTADTRQNVTTETEQAEARKTNQEGPAEDTQETKSEGIEKIMTAYAGEVMKKINQQKAEKEKKDVIIAEKEENKQPDGNAIVSEAAEIEHKQSEAAEKQTEEKEEESNEVTTFRTIKPIVIPTSAPEPKEKTDKTKKVVKVSEAPAVQTQKTEKTVAASTKTQPQKKTPSKTKTPEIKISQPQKKKTLQSAEIELEDNDMEIVVE